MTRTERVAGSLLIALVIGAIVVPVVARQDPLAIDDQPAALAHDVARLLETPLLPKGTLVVGMIYDLGSGRLDTVVPPASAG